MTSAPPRQIEGEIAVVICSIEVACPARDGWLRIGGFADAGRFLNIASEESSGQGGIGSVRWVGGAIVEVMVGASDASYTYVQTQGPMAQNLYHGCVALSPSGNAACRLTYTITYDESSLSHDERAMQRRRTAERLQGAIESMKEAAESLNT